MFDIVYVYFQDTESNQQDSLSQIIEDTIGDTIILDNGSITYNEEDLVYVAVDGQHHVTNKIDAENRLNIEKTVNNAANEKSIGAIGIDNNGDMTQRNTIISMPTVEI